MRQHTCALVDDMPPLCSIPPRDNQIIRIRQHMSVYVMHYGVAQSPEIFYAPTNTNKAIYGLGFWLSRVLSLSRFSPTHTKTLQLFCSHIKWTYAAAKACFDAYVSIRQHTPRQTTCRRRSLLRKMHTSAYVRAAPWQTTCRSLAPPAQKHTSAYVE